MTGSLIVGVRVDQPVSIPQNALKLKLTVKP